MMAETLDGILRGRGYEVDWTASWDDAAELLRSRPYDLVLVDADRPREVDVNWAIAGSAAILFLIHRDTRADFASEDDSEWNRYLMVPFDLDCLEARLEMIASRQTGRGPHRISHGTLTLDVDSREAAKAGKSLVLTSCEYELLCAFVEQPNRVFRRDEIEAIMDRQMPAETVLDDLRDKIGSEEIWTVRGVGYRLRGTANSVTRPCFPQTVG